MKRSKYLYSFILLGTISLSALAACGNNNETPFVPEVIEYTKVDTVPHYGFYLKKGASATINVNFDIKNNNYLRLDVKSDINVVGNYQYSNLADSTEVVSESFFIEKCDEKTPQKHFLDAFRPETLNHNNCTAKKAHEYYGIPNVTKMARGLFEKKLEKITLKNVSDEDGTIEIYGLYMSPRKLPQEEIYLESGYLKIGVDLMGGGALSYLERTYYETTKGKYYIDEICTGENTAYIGVDANSQLDRGGMQGSTDHHVNLINYFDPGRLIQQSFYSEVGGSKTETLGENGYTRWFCTTADANGYFWPYNPVQSGDCHTNISQVVDYAIEKDTLYVKAKPLDWAGSNSVTDSYMESWFTIKNGNVYAKNKFTNFAGFTEMETLDPHSLELPATYIAHPLNTLVTYQGETPWTNDTAGLVYQDNLATWKYGADIVNKHPEDWFAWVNADKFGVGMYIPDVSFYASGRSITSTNLSESQNVDSSDSPEGDKSRLAYNKKEAYYSFQSCYTRNTDYTAPEIRTTMLDYIPFEYEYVLCVDYLDVIRNNFKNIYKSGEVDNSSMFVWDEHIKNN